MFPCTKRNLKQQQQELIRQYEVLQSYLDVNFSILQIQGNTNQANWLHILCSFPVEYGIEAIGQRVSCYFLKRQSRKNNRSKNNFSLIVNYRPHVIRDLLPKHQMPSGNFISWYTCTACKNACGHLLLYTSRL